MIVVADTSPLGYLIQLGYEGLLPRLFGRILLPDAVMQELKHPGAPPAVHAWLAELPGWVDVCFASNEADAELAFLDPGERQAIQLAEEQAADLLLIDEKKGRIEARRRGIRTTGTLGVLLVAGAADLIDPADAYRRLLTETTFRTSSTLEAHFFRRIRSGL